MKKKNFRRLLALTLSLSLTATLLSGCGGSGDNSGSNAEGQQGTGDIGSVSTERGDMPRADYLVSLATPLSAEDQEIWDNIDAKSDGDAVVLRYGTVNRNLDETVSMRTARQFLIELKKQLGDAVEIQIFTGGTLGTTSDQIIGGIQTGAFECYSYNVGSFAEYTNAFMPLDIMYLIPDFETGMAAVEGEPGQLMRQKCLDDTGVNVICYPAIGMRQMTNSNREIVSPDDLSGLKLRVQNNPLHILGMETLGGAVTSIAFSELFTSMQQKVVDGQENPIMNIYEQNYDEVQSYMSLTNHLFTADAIIMNNDWLTSQSSEFQAAVTDAAAIAQEYTGNELMKVEEKLLDELKTTMTVTELTEEQLSAFRTLSETCWDKAAETIGVDYFNEVRASIEKLIA